jgi:hypothetical protein
MRKDLGRMEVHLGGLREVIDKQDEEMDDLNAGMIAASYVDLSDKLPLKDDEAVDTFFGDITFRNSLSKWMVRGPPRKKVTLKMYCRAILEHIFSDDYMADHYWKTKK